MRVASSKLRSEPNHMVDLYIVPPVMSFVEKFKMYSD